MIVTGRHLPRRTFLKGMGVAVALPVFDAMVPAFASASGSASARGVGEAGSALARPLRLAFTYVPNGITMADWTPASEGAGFEFTRILKPLEPFREDALVLSGLAHRNGLAAIWPVLIVAGRRDWNGKLFTISSTSAENR